MLKLRLPQCSPATISRLHLLMNLHRFPKIFSLTAKLPRTIPPEEQKWLVVFINGAVAPFFQQNLVEHIKKNPFSIAIDGSSDNDIEKTNALTVRILDVNCGNVRTLFLDMCMSSSSTAEGIFSKMDDAFTTHYISWDNCLGLGVDNTSVNMGCRNSIKTLVLERNPAIYIMGCPCHIVHNTALKAAQAFEEVNTLMFVLKTV